MNLGFEPVDKPLAATAARIQLGYSTDLKVIQAIRENPGISMYNLGKTLNFAVGRIDGSIDRLQERGEVDVQYELRDGRISKGIYPKGFAGAANPEILIDANLLQDPRAWKDRAFVYALDRITLGICPSQLEEWDKKSLMKEEVELKRAENSIVVDIPARLLDFYIWNNSLAQLSVIGNQVLITLKTTIPVVTSAKPLDYFHIIQAAAWASTLDVIGTHILAAGTPSPKPRIISEETEETYGNVLVVAKVR